MYKQEFLNELKDRLSGLPKEDVEERLAFYGEMIDDCMEEGMAEEEAVANAGSIDSIVDQTLEDIPLAKIVKQKVKRERSMRGWEKALLIVGAPLWFPLAAAALIVIIALYAVLWSLIISLWAIEAAFIACAAGCLIASVVAFIKGEAAYGAALIGAALVCAGISILLFHGCVAATKGTARFTKKIVLAIKSRLVRKETEK